MADPVKGSRLSRLAFPLLVVSLSLTQVCPAGELHGVSVSIVAAEQPTLLAAIYGQPDLAVKRSMTDLACESSYATPQTKLCWQTSSADLFTRSHRDPTLMELGVRLQI